MSDSPATGGIRNPDLLGIYVNDHLMAATGGVELVSRMLGEHRDSRYASRLEELLGQLREERSALTGIMKALGIPVRQYKQVATWVAEKVSRLKLNGRLLSRSPLSSLIEFEFIANAVLGKRAGFETLRQIAEIDSRLDAPLLDRLIRQANDQHRWLIEARREIAADVFGGDKQVATEVAGT
jgi:hypothetical protein